MKKRRPTASDRDIADYMRNLPDGEHRIVVERETFPFVRVKAEGMMAFPTRPRDDRPWGLVCIYPGSK